MSFIWRSFFIHFNTALQWLGSGGWLAHWLHVIRYSPSSLRSALAFIIFSINITLGRIRCISFLGYSPFGSCGWSSVMNLCGQRWSSNIVVTTLRAFALYDWVMGERWSWWIQIFSHVYVEPYLFERSSSLSLHTNKY